MLHISNNGLLSLVCSVVFINAEKIKISKICDANFIEPEGIESIKIVPVLNWGQYLIKITMEVVDICWYWFWIRLSIVLTTYFPSAIYQTCMTQKQPSRVVLRKRYSDNTQQIYRRRPMPKCNFNKVALQLYWNRASAWVFSCKFAAYFQKTFS